MFMKIDNIYNQEKTIKNIREYNIANGNIGIVLSQYNISTQKFVCVHSTCHQKNAPMYQTKSINKNDNINQSKYLLNSSFFIFNNIKRTNKNQNIAQNKEKS